MNDIEVGKIEQLTESDFPGLDLPEEKDCETCKNNFEKTHITIKRHNEIQIETNDRYDKKIKGLTAEIKLLELENKKLRKAIE